MDLQKIRGTIETLIVGAGKEAMRYWGQDHQEITKTNIYDVVTEADTAIEAMIVPQLHALFPDHHFVGEEGGSNGTAADEAEYFWYIDPIDGTVNYAHHLPMFAISIGLSDRAGQPLVGAVLNPVSGELFSAARGYGATLNGERICVTHLTSLNQALVASGFSPNKELATANARMWLQFISKTRDLRRLGSAALDLCYVACGRLDGYWEPNLKPWDIAAGMLVLTEAGGRISDYSGCIDKVYKGEQVVASNGLIHEQMLNILQNPN